MIILKKDQNKWFNLPGNPSKLAIQNDNFWAIQIGKSGLAGVNFEIRIEKVKGKNMKIRAGKAEILRLPW